jgi:outer membrane protein
MNPFHGWLWPRLARAPLLAVVWLGLCATTVLAQTQPGELRIGYVNSDRVMREANVARAAEQKLEVEAAKRRKDIEALAARLKVASDRLDKDGPALTELERSRRQREVLDLDRDLQRRTREFQEDLNQRKNEELASVVERVNRVIKDIAERERFDLIVQEVIFAGPRVDITKKVIDALNAAK